MSVSGVQIEEGAELALDFGKLDRATGCVPVAIQRQDTLEVVLVAYTNEAAMREAFRTRRLVLWSTSRQAMWKKGATSGHRFALVEAYVNCEQNSLLYRVLPLEPDAGVRTGICHTVNRAGEPRDCFYRRIDLDTLRLENTNP
ncbi:MAG: phosphoribosyl-AMP cyclohydrolase [Kiritimatiellia bacterium]